jgi:hypothetical protein
MLKQCGVAVMAKASEPGRAKTRLCPPLTLEEASRFNTAFLRDIAQNLEAAGELASIRGYMAYGPPGSESFFGFLPGGIGLIETWFPNFGDCLTHALEQQFALGHKAACVLNSDSPTLPTDVLVRAAAILAEREDRVVLGPSTDGGYYLLGLTRMHKHLFEDIAWSTGAVTAQTLARAAEIGLEVELLPEWYDVDDAEALRVLTRELLHGVPFDSALPSSPATHSHKLLAELMRDGLEGRLGFAMPRKAAC